MTRMYVAFLLILLAPATGIQAQSSRKARSWEFKGYLNDMQMVQFEKINDPWVFDNTFLNRLDVSWTPGKVFSLGIGMRNRFLFGQTLSQNPAYKGSVTTDPGLVNLTWDLWSGPSYLLVTQFDRAWVKISLGKIELTTGRQRINWGQAFVWNPNDVFNTYSYYDFDYPERPGSDAIRFQWYPSATSVTDGAVKWDSQGRITAAGLIRFNIAQYDIQVLGGLVNDQDYVVGTGWSGNLFTAGFRGEISYFYPKHPVGDTSGLLLATIGADYTFSNSLSLTFQAFYNQLPPGFQPNSFWALYQAPPSPKILSFAEWNLFLQGTYPITPLLNLSLAAIWFPDRKGYFIGPTLNYSLRESLELSFFTQYFNGTFPGSGQQPDLPFEAFLSALRLTWNF